MSHAHHKTDPLKQINNTQFTKGQDRQHIADIQEAFIRDVFQRFRNIRGRIRDEVGYNTDRFNLRSGGPENRVQAKQRFAQWVKRIAITALGLDIATDSAQNGENFTGQYILGAAIQGFNQATGQLLQTGLTISNPDDEDIRELVEPNLSGPNARYISPINEFEDVTDEMAVQITSILDEGFDEGWNPRKMANEINTEVKKMERSRAVTIARTETSFSHAEQTLQRYADAGVEGVGHAGRIVTPDESLCAWCRSIRDVTFTLDEFRGTRVLWRGQKYFVGVPAHVNGRCAPIPKPGVDELPPLEDRLPTGATVIATGLNMYNPGVV